MIKMGPEKGPANQITEYTGIHNDHQRGTILYVFFIYWTGDSQIQGQNIIGVCIEGGIAQPEGIERSGCVMQDTIYIPYACVTPAILHTKELHISRLAGRTTLKNERK